MVVENKPLYKPVSAGLRQFPHPGKIWRRHCGRRFDFDSNHVAAPVFDDNIDLVLILVPKVGKGASLIAPGGDFLQFAEHECFKNGSEGCLVLANDVGGNDSQSREEPGVEKMKFRRFCQSLQLVGEPGLEGLNDEQAFKDV